MRVLHTADWHLGKKLETFSRIEEQRAVLEEICGIAEEKEVDVVLIAGDLYDTFNPSTEAEDLFYKTLRRLSAQGKRPVVAIAGNHDSPDRIEAPDPLARACGIFLAGFPDSHIKSSTLESGVQVDGKAPGLVEIQLPSYSYPLRLLLTPYANEQRLKTCFDSADAERETRDLLKNHWQSLADRYCDDRGVNMLLAHLFFADEGQEPEEEPEEERPVLYVGGAQVLYTSSIPSQIQYTALGHLHRCIRMGGSAGPVVYSGSPLGYSFAEASQDKHVMLIDAEPGREAKLEKVKLANGRRLLRKRFEDIDECVEWLSQNQRTLLELTIVTEEFLTGLERKRLFAAHDGIVAVIPELRGMKDVSTESTVIDPARDIRELFREYFISRNGQAPNQEIIDLFNEVLAENPGT